MEGDRGRREFGLRSQLRGTGNDGNRRKFALSDITLPVYGRSRRWVKSYPFGNGVFRSEKPRGFIISAL
jgi:hypothetical protein